MADCYIGRINYLPKQSPYVQIEAFDGSERTGTSGISLKATHEGVPEDYIRVGALVVVRRKTYKGKQVGSGYKGWEIVPPSDAQINLVDTLRRRKDDTGDKPDFGTIEARTLATLATALCKVHNEEVLRANQAYATELEESQAANKVQKNVIRELRSKNEILKSRDPSPGFEALEAKLEDWQKDVVERLASTKDEILDELDAAVDTIQSSTENTAVNTEAKAPEFNAGDHVVMTWDLGSDEVSFVKSKYGKPDLPDAIVGDESHQFKTAAEIGTEAHRQIEKMVHHAFFAKPEDAYKGFARGGYVKSPTGRVVFDPIFLHQHPKPWPCPYKAFVSIPKQSGKAFDMALQLANAYGTGKKKQVEMLEQRLVEKIEDLRELEGMLQKAKDQLRLEEIEQVLDAKKSDEDFSEKYRTVPNVGGIMNEALTLRRKLREDKYGEPVEAPINNEDEDDGDD